MGLEACAVFAFYHPMGYACWWWEKNEQSLAGNQEFFSCFFITKMFTSQFLV